LCRSASVTLSRGVCVRRISLGGEGNALYPVLCSYYICCYVWQHLLDLARLILGFGFGFGFGLSLGLGIGVGILISCTSLL